MKSRYLWDSKYAGDNKRGKRNDGIIRKEPLDEMKTNRCLNDVTSILGSDLGLPTDQALSKDALSICREFLSEATQSSEASV